MAVSKYFEQIKVGRAFLRWQQCFPLQFSTGSEKNGFSKDGESKESRQLPETDSVRQDQRKCLLMISRLKQRAKNTHEAHETFYTGVGV